MQQALSGDYLIMTASTRRQSQSSGQSEAGGEIISHIYVSGAAYSSTARSSGDLILTSYHCPPELSSCQGGNAQRMCSGLIVLEINESSHKKVSLPTKRLQLKKLCVALVGGRAVGIAYSVGGHHGTENLANLILCLCSRVSQLTSQIAPTQQLIF